MVIKVYISGISGNKEVKKRQQRVLMILESKNVEYKVIDITEPDKEAEKEFMQMNSTARDSKYPLPPQIFCDEDYCGDYEDFDEANEMDELDKFLKGPAGSSEEPSQENNMETNDVHQNGNTTSREPSTDKDAASEKLNSLEERRTDDLEKNSEAKDLTEDLDLDLDNDEKTDDMSDNQENEE